MWRCNQTLIPYLTSNGAEACGARRPPRQCERAFWPACDGAFSHAFQPRPLATPPHVKSKADSAHFFLIARLARRSFFRRLFPFFSVARMRFDGAFFLEKIEHRAPLLGTRANERVALHAPGLAIKTLNRVGV